jgi:hypothetical protein
LKTALRRLNRPTGGGTEAAVIAELEEVSARLQAGFDRAREIADTEQRRAMLREIGPLVGRLDSIMVEQDDGDIARELLHREAIQDAITQFCLLWRGEPGQTSA